MENMPPGYRFYPTEEELITFYLHNKLEGAREYYMNRVIPVVNIYDYKPSQLPQVSGEASLKDTEQWFFFIQRQESEAQGGRPKRLTNTGYWKATGSPNHVYSSDNRVIGMKRTMVFYSGRAPNGRKTDWKMNEYKAIEEEEASSSSDHKAPGPKLRQEFSLCRVYKKSKCLRAFDRRPPPRRDTARYHPRADQNAAHHEDHNKKGSTLYDHSHDNDQMVERRSVTSSPAESSSSGEHGQLLPSLHDGELAEATQMDVVDNEPLLDWEQVDWFLGSAAP